MTFLGQVDNGPGNRWLRFGGVPDSGGTLTFDLRSQLALIISMGNYRWNSQFDGGGADGGSLCCPDAFLMKSVRDWGTRVAVGGCLDGPHLSAGMFRHRHTNTHTLLFYLEPTSLIVVDADWLHWTTTGPVTQLEPPSSSPITADDASDPTPQALSSNRNSSGN